MQEDIRIKLSEVIETIFSNWTVVQLAVNHSMGGPRTLDLVNQLKSSLVDICLGKQTISFEEIEDYLEDILENQFNVICEDDSTTEIANIIVRFLDILKSGDQLLFSNEFQKLPKRTVLEKRNVNQLDDQMETDSSETMESDQEDEEGWTTVRRKTKKKTKK